MKRFSPSRIRRERRLLIGEMNPPHCCPIHHPSRRATILIRQFGHCGPKGAFTKALKPSRMQTHGGDIWIRCMSPGRGKIAARNESYNLIDAASAAEPNSLPHPIRSNSRQVWTHRHHPRPAAKNALRIQSKCALNEGRCKTKRRSYPTCLCVSPHRQQNEAERTDAACPLLRHRFRFGGVRNRIQSIASASEGIADRGALIFPS